MNETVLSTKDLIKLGIKRTMLYDLFRHKQWPVFKNYKSVGTGRKYSVEDAAKIICVKILNDKLGISVQKAGELVWGKNN